jgi:hypothetical protein
MLASAVRLQAAAAEQERILRDPANRRLSGREVLQKVAPALQAGSSESARFNRALIDNRRLVDQCKLQAPDQAGKPGRSALHGGEHDHIRPVVPSGGVEFPAAGHQPQRRGQGGVVHGIGGESVLEILRGPLDHEPDR